MTRKLTDPKECARRCGRHFSRNGGQRYCATCAPPRAPLSGSRARCGRCPRTFKRRHGRQFCMVCSGSRLSKRLRNELARNPRETP